MVKQYEQSPGKYDGKALEFQHAREIKQQQKVRIKKYPVSFLECKSWDVKNSLKEVIKTPRFVTISMFSLFELP